MDIPARTPALEFTEQEALEQLQLAQLHKTVGWALKTGAMHSVRALEDHELYQL
ncbi:MAG: hypothetical protein U1F42_01910 [Candidatus Competibacteraceae bacterium]